MIHVKEDGIWIMNKTIAFIGLQANMMDHISKNRLIKRSRVLFVGKRSSCYSHEEEMNSTYDVTNRMYYIPQVQLEICKKKK